MLVTRRLTFNVLLPYLEPLFFFLLFNFEFLSKPPVYRLLYREATSSAYTLFIILFHSLLLQL